MLSENEFTALRALLPDGVGVIHDLDARQSLLAKGYVRPDPRGVAITIEGHFEYIKELARAFD